MTLSYDHHILEEEAVRLAVGSMNGGTQTGY